MARKVIKGEAPVSPPVAGPALSERKVIDREIYKAQQRTDQIKQEAEEKAAARRDRGKQEAQAAHDAAHQEGAAEGMVAAAGLALQAYWNRGEALRLAVDDCVVIGRHICAKIVGRPLKLGDVECRNIAEELVGLAIERRKLRIGFAPDDWDALKRTRPMLVSVFERHGELELGPDPESSSGLAAIGLSDGQFNAPLEGMVRALADLFGVGDEAPPEAPERSAGRRRRGQGEAVEAAPEEDAAAAAEALQGSEEEEDEEYEEDEYEPLPLEEGSIGLEEEQVQYHDISAIVARIDAEDDEEQ